jgi:histidinol-phosphate aminotransferase
VLFRNKKTIDVENSIRVSIGTQEQMSFFWSTYKKLDLNN